jgi:PAS domain S-box-containing protein
MNELLKKQIEKYFGGTKKIPEQFQPFISAVDEAYRGFDSDHKLIERSMEISSRELADLNDSLKKERDFSKSIVDTAPAIILVLDTKGRIVDFNPFMEELTGYQLDELKGKDWFFVLLPKSDRDQVRNFFRSTIGIEKTQVSVNPIVTKDGRKLFIEWHSKTLKDKVGGKVVVLAIGQNITERKREQEAMDKKNVSLLTQQEASIDGILVVDEEGEVASVNQNFFKIMGVPEKLRGEKGSKPLLDFVARQMVNPKEYGDRVQFLFKHRLVCSHEEVSLKSGTILDRYSSPMFGFNGQYYGRVWYFRDITDRKKSDKNLRVSQRRMSDIIQFLPDATMVIDLDGKVIAWNRAIENLTGIKTADMLGKGNYEYSIPLYGKRRPILVDLALKPNKTFEKKYSNIVRSGDNLTGEGVAHSAVRKGDFYFLSIATALRDPNEKIVGAIMSVRDITERRLAEMGLKKAHDELEIRVQERTADLNKSRNEVEQEKARAEAYLSSIGEGVLAIDLKGRIVLMNLAAEQILGKPFSAVQNKSFEKAFHWEDSEGQLITPSAPFVIKAIRDRKITITVCNFFSKTEGKIPLATTFSPILVMGKFIGPIITFRDIRQEEKFDRSKSEFIDLASHQMRTPLTGLKWILEEAKNMKSIDAWKKEYLNDGLTSVQRMISLVHNLLNVSRVETGAIAVNSETVNLGDFIAEFLKGEAQLVANGKKQQIHFAKPPRPILAVIDKQLLRQVVSNLVSNSIRYSLEKTTIEIHVRKMGQKFDLIIRDKGIGIRQKDQKHLFEKFFRAEEASRYSTTGSGLGLYIVQKVLKILNGDIRCDSELGKGATFTVTLPLKAAIRKGEGKELFEHVIS